MACGCATNICNCVVRGGDGVTVSGAGTVTNPFVIDLDEDFSLAGRFIVQDTNSVNLTLTGNGSVATPWTLRADTALELGDLLDVDVSNPTVGWVLGRGPGGDFEMMPPAVAAPGAVFADQTSVIGDGTIGDLFRVFDYEFIPFMDGADPTHFPNASDITLGDSTDPTVRNFRINRGSTPGDPFTQTSIEFRPYDWGSPIPGYGAAIAVEVDGIEQARWVLRPTGQITITAPDGFTYSPPFRQLTGAGSIPVTGGSSSGTLNIAFPAGMFTQIPRIFVTMQETGSTTAAEQLFILSADNKSTGGFRAVGRHAQGAGFNNSNIQFAWHAIQQGP